MRHSFRGLRASRLWFVFALALSGAAPLAAEVPDKPDIRVLIDISGSMRQNDPKNLRQPALRMLSGLLQPGTRAGVWTFARRADQLVPVAEVDATWKTRVLSLSERIGSPGQFTNVEEVLEKAAQDWKGQPTHSRHLLLLTDGMVDTSKDPDESLASRERILEKLLPRLKAAEVKVHTVALSGRADHELMRRLAGDTGGWYQQVEQAEELQRAFLRMFETVGRPEGVPLQDNRFIVDSSVNEATVLVFRRPGSDPVVLHSPSGEAFTDSDLPAGVAWHRDQGYELITVASPEKGEWHLEAEVDPDNRVMIVTDLKLGTSEVPSHIAAGEKLRVSAFLNNRGKLVDRQAFLRLLEVHAETASEDGREVLALNDAGEEEDEKAADGRYTMRLLEPQAREAVELLVAVDSPTFMRERRLRLAVHEPVDAAVEAGETGPRLSLRSQTAVMAPGIEVAAWQEDSEGRHTPLVLIEDAPEEWHAELSDPRAPSYVRVAGTTLSGNSIERTLGPLMPAGVAPPPVVVEPVPEPDEALESQPAVATAEQPPAQATDAAETVSEEGWLMPALLFAGFNLLLLVAAGVWFLFRRRRAAAGETESERALDVLIEEQDAGSNTDGARALQEDAA